MRINPAFRSISAFLITIGLVGIVGCTEAEEGEPSSSEEAADYEEVQWDTSGKGDTGISATFDRHLVVSDAVFTDTESISVADVQWFFENTPYGGRSWLAGERINGTSAAEAVVAAARAKGINPIMLLGRMQIEKSLISKPRPSQAQVNAALGCGCPDYRRCNPAYSGLDRQLNCAADTFEEHYTASRNGDGRYRVGITAKTLDNLSITSRSHATSSLYAYTPWVLTGRGGNWLAWNITRKFLKHLDDAGRL
jgi:hypothetical protein